MKTIYLDRDIDEFVEQVSLETTKGNDVTVSMHGFKAVVYGGTSESMVRRLVLSKLKSIKSYGENVQILSRQISGELLYKYLINSTPDVVAELCLEEGLLSTPSKSKSI